MSFVEATETFLDAAESWLTPADAPAVAGMRAAAEALDVALHPPVLAQYRLFHSGLLKRQPVDDGPVDELEALLKDAG